jgi:hypothetical protein
MPGTLSEAEAVTQAVREAGEEALSSYLAQTAEQRDKELASSFEAAFAQCAAQTLDQATLETCLGILSAQLDELIETTDNLLFVQEEAESLGQSSTAAHDAIAWRIRASHAQFQRYINAFCEPSATTAAARLLGSVSDDAAAAALEGDGGVWEWPMVGRDEVVLLLQWCRDYTLRIFSIGQPHVAQELPLLQQSCRTPMAEYIGAAQMEVSKWLEGIRRCEKVQWESDGGTPHSSLAADLWGLIGRTTRTAASSGSEWLLMNVCEGVIVPQVRLWATQFADELQIARVRHCFVVVLRAHVSSLRSFCVCDQSKVTSYTILLPHIVILYLIELYGWTIRAPTDEL